MIVNMCEINGTNIIFGHQFVKAIHHLTFTFMQPPRMFNKMCHDWCVGVHKIGISGGP